jgi:uncharacterized protein YbaP (TraB family)
MKRLVCLLFALFICLGPARAEAPACSGTDLLAKVKAENPALYDEVVAEARAEKNGEAILWKVERDGREPSYLFGTAHVTDHRITELSPAAEDALDNATTVALELREIRNQQEMGLAAMRNARFMVLPPGKTLWDLIPDDQEHLIRDNSNLPPGAAEAIWGYQPWVVAMMLSLPVCEIKRRQAGILSLDEALAHEAENNGAELVGLETPAEQFAALSSMPMEDQLKYLLAIARLSGRSGDYFETLIHLYQQRLITALKPLANRLEIFDEGVQSLMNGMEASLLTRRNHVMAERSAPLIEAGNAFIAVGAMHLPGDEGLVELLRQAGYKVTPIN